MSLTLVSSSEKDIGGTPSMQSSYSAELKRNGICMEERNVHVNAWVEIWRDILQTIDNYGGTAEETFDWRKSWANPWKQIMNPRNE